jgi:hypothetical protein
MAGRQSARSGAGRVPVLVLSAAVLLVALTLVGGGAARGLAAPKNTTEPTIAGAALVGKTLTGNRGTWTGGSLSFTYAWARCDKSGSNCSLVSGATGTKYGVTSADLGATLRFRVTAKNSDGQETANSNATSVVATSSGQPASTAAPTISGSPIVGQELSASNGTWVGDEPLTYSYQWQHCDDAGNACKAISGATTRTYKVAKGLVGDTIRVKVTAKNSRGSASAISTATAAVQDAGGGGGIINLPGGGKSVAAADVPKGERLIVDRVAFNPSTVRSRSRSR